MSPSIWRSKTQKYRNLREKKDEATSWGGKKRGMNGKKKYSVVFTDIIE